MSQMTMSATAIMISGHLILGPHAKLVDCNALGF